MNHEPVWSVIIMVVLAMCFASYCIWWILWEAHLENVRDSKEKNESN